MLPEGSQILCSPPRGRETLKNVKRPRLTYTGFQVESWGSRYYREGRSVGGLCSLPLTQTRGDGRRAHVVRRLNWGELWRFGLKLSRTEQNWGELTLGLGGRGSLLVKKSTFGQNRENRFLTQKSVFWSKFGFPKGLNLLIPSQGGVKRSIFGFFDRGKGHFSRRRVHLFGL